MSPHLTTRQLYRGKIVLIDISKQFYRFSKLTLEVVPIQLIAGAVVVVSRVGSLDREVPSLIPSTYNLFQESSLF